MITLNHTDKEIQSESKSIAQVIIQNLVPVECLVGLGNRPDERRILMRIPIVL